jgi:hypothetical protein
MMATVIVRLALSTLLSLARPPAVDPIAERPRIEQMANDIAGVVEQADELATWLPGAGTGSDTVLPLPFTGSRSQEATALALVAIAWGESHLRADVADCRRTGDRRPWEPLSAGRSITAFQLHRGQAWGPFSRGGLCASGRLAAERALWVLSSHAARCRTPAAAFFGYASGNCSRRSAAGARHCKRWERLCAAAGIGASCGRREVL